MEAAISQLSSMAENDGMSVEEKSVVQHVDTLLLAYLIAENVVHPESNGYPSEENGN